MSNSHMLLDRLQLPAPETLKWDDPLLGEAYARFCQGLQPTNFADAILANPWFAPNECLAEPDARDLARLQLYAALIRPDRGYLDYLFGRTFLVDEVLKQQGKFSGHIYQYGIGQSFKAFARFAETADASRLASLCEPLQVLEHLSAEIASAPGLTWLSDVQCITWTDKWGIALHYFDAENDQGDAFPRLLGFFRMETYPFSAARLLTQIPEEFVHLPGAYIYGIDLLAFCWMRLGDEGEFNLAGHLAELTDEQIAELKSQSGDFCSRDFIDTMEALWLHFTEFRDRQWERNILKILIKRKGVSDFVAWLDRHVGREAVV